VVYAGIGHTWPTASKAGTPAVSNLMWKFLAGHRLASVPLKQTQGPAAAGPTP
jgi:hypothetical protein